MIKQINSQNFLTSPFVTQKTWELSNTNNDDLILLESGSQEYTLALEFVDYSSGTGVLNTSCSIALENQSDDLAVYQQGYSGSGTFNTETEPINNDGTYQRSIYSLINAAFYNNYKDPFKIFGVENIDFPLSNTYRNISDYIRVFNIPQTIFGERIIPNSLVFEDETLDDNVKIIDDGNQNLIAFPNLFSQVQEVRAFGNNILSGSV